jgi:transketolase
MTSIQPENLQKQVRRIVLEQSMRAHVGHIGSALSIAHILAALYGSVLRISDPEDPDRDRCVLSKGHAALSLYAVLFLKGWISQADLDSYCADGTLLGVHPERNLRGVDFSTGSLGQGLSYGVGAALAAEMQNSARKVYVVASDAECNEGSTWEAAMFAAHHHLSNLTLILDVNGQQALGRTADVLNLEPLAARWQAFGWEASECDGHIVEELVRTILGDVGAASGPRVVLAQTVCGKGVSYMEGNIKWHYWPMSEEEYRRAVQELEAEQ